MNTCFIINVLLFIIIIGIIIYYYTVRKPILQQISINSSSQPITHIEEVPTTAPIEIKEDTTLPDSTVNRLVTIDNNVNLPTNLQIDKLLNDFTPIPLDNQLLTLVTQAISAVDLDESADLSRWKKIYTDNVKWFNDPLMHPAYGHTPIENKVNLIKSLRDRNKIDEYRRTLEIKVDRLF